MVDGEVDQESLGDAADLDVEIVRLHLPTHATTILLRLHVEMLVSASPAVHQGVLNKGVALLQKPFTPSALAHKLREVLDEASAPKPDTTQQTFGFASTADGNEIE